jgi:hypothetical protein
MIKFNSRIGIKPIHKCLLFTIPLTMMFALLIIANCCTMNSYTRLGKLIYLPTISKLVGVGRSGYESPNVIISKLDFVPLTRDDYLINWPGPPRKAVEYSDCYHFKPVIELQDPAPKTFTRDFDIVADHSPDEMIGVFTATFEEGSRVPNEIKYLSIVPGSGARAPAGTPDVIYDKFWMGCTKKGKIKANGIKDDRKAKVYITLSPVMIPADGVIIGGVGKSRKHRVKCN